MNICIFFQTICQIYMRCNLDIDVWKPQKFSVKMKVFESYWIAKWMLFNCTRSKENSFYVNRKPFENDIELLCLRTHLLRKNECLRKSYTLCNTINYFGEYNPCCLYTRSQYTIMGYLSYVIHLLHIFGYCIIKVVILVIMLTINFTVVEWILKVSIWMYISYK